jgi:hypothetical protein
MKDGRGGGGGGGGCAGSVKDRSSLDEAEGGSKLEFDCRVSLSGLASSLLIQMAEELTEKLAEGATGRLEIIAELIVGGTLELTATGEHETVAASEAIVIPSVREPGGL